MSSQEKLKVGVSSCLLGDNVRFDGGHKRNRFIIEKLGTVFEFRAFCPEVSIGLGVPRQPIRLVTSEADSSASGFRVVGTRDAQLDVTSDLLTCANQQQKWINDLCGYIFKKDSPSCGVNRVKYYENGHPTREGGVGLYAGEVIRNNPLLPVEEEGRLNDSHIRENFIQAVYAYSRWKQLCREGLTPGKLLNFHARHKLIVMSRSQSAYKTLGRLLANLAGDSFDTIASQYIETLMQAFKKIGTRKNHVNVLQHIQGYLRGKIDSKDRMEITGVIESYRKEVVPLIVPITLLKHHFGRNPNDYIKNSFYLQPYPEALSLQNNI